MRSVAEPELVEQNIFAKDRAEAKVFLAQLQLMGRMCKFF
jgi:hypothetical protein